MEMLKEKQNKVFDVLKGSFGYVNQLQAPRIVKVVVSVGTGSIKDKAKIDLIPD